MRVLVFGTFDNLHPGHEFLLKKAREFGDELCVVVALDKTVQEVKSRLPQQNQQERLVALMASGFVDEVVLGREGDKYAVIESVCPDVIVLGYDQEVFVTNLQEKLEKRGLRTRVVRVEESFMPEKYKSSLLRSS
ncbi:MAG: adenylyltransferase/cytidyltransferase family protein [Candidatus Woesearchaeota archaeon]